MEEVTHEMRVLGQVEGGWQLAASWPCPAYRHEILELNSKVGSYHQLIYVWEHVYMVKKKEEGKTIRK